MNYSIYDHLDYRLLIKSGITDLKDRLGGGITYSSMAKACRIQKTYLSKVLNHDGNLTQDQLFLACEYLRLDPNETDYALLLHLHESTNLEKRKKLLKTEIHSIQRATKKSEAYLNTTIIENHTDTLITYFLNPDLQLIHLFLTIEKYQKNLNKIATSIGIKKTELDQHLATLESMKLVKFEDKCYIAINHNLHLPKESPIYPSYRSMMKLKSMEKVRNINDDAYSLGAFISCSPETKDFIHKKFLVFLGDIKKRVDLDEPEEVYQLSFDLINW
jgi:hypothetical protein